MGNLQIILFGNQIYLFCYGFDLSSGMIYLFGFNAMAII
jgi:hypothetical protein